MCVFLLFQERERETLTQKSARFFPLSLSLLQRASFSQVGRDRARRILSKRSRAATAIESLESHPRRLSLSLSWKERRRSTRTFFESESAFVFSPLASFSNFCQKSRSHEVKVDRRGQGECCTLRQQKVAAARDCGAAAVRGAAGGDGGAPTAVGARDSARVVAVPRAAALHGDKGGVGGGAVRQAAHAVVAPARRGARGNGRYPPGPEGPHEQPQVAQGAPQTTPRLSNRRRAPPPRQRKQAPSFFVPFFLKSLKKARARVSLQRVTSVGRER